MKPISDNKYIWLAALHPLAVAFLVPDLLFDIVKGPDPQNFNLIFSLISILFVWYMYSKIYQQVHVIQKSTFIVVAVVVYLTLGVWVLLQAADFGIALHRSVWGAIYLTIVVLQTLLFIGLYMKYNC